MCSPGNPLCWEEWLTDQQGEVSRRIRIGKDLADLLKDMPTGLVIVARAGRENAKTAIAALNAGHSVLVEKPFALNRTEAERVVEAASQQVCVTGLVFMFASNLHCFVNAAKEIGKLEEVQVEWHDPVGETRYGESKAYDPSLNCVVDVFPHIWSLLRLIDPISPLKSQKAHVEHGGRSVKLELVLGDAIVTADIARDADARRRAIVVRGSNGEGAIDFAREPGSATVNGTPIDIATGFSSPLACELETAARGMVDTPVARFCQVGQAIEAVMLADDFLPQVRRDQFQQIGQGITSAAMPVEYEAAKYALNELILDRIWNHGRNDVDLSGKISEGNLQTYIRDWLMGSASDRDVPACVREDPGFLALKKQLIRTSGV